MNEFRTGDHVEFTDTRVKGGGRIVKGVITKVGPKRRGRRRYGVETTCGASFRVPCVHLRPAKLKAGEGALLHEQGLEKLEEREAVKAKRKAKKAERLAPRASTFHYGDAVEVYTRGAWMETHVVRVNAESGKVTVDNPMVRLVQAFGALPNGRRVAKTITVGSNKVRRANERRFF